MFAADSGGKLAEATVRGVGHVVLHPLTLAVFVFIRPAVFLCCGYPFLQGRGAIIKMELQNLAFQHLNVIHTLKENVLIKFIQPKRRSAGFTENSLRDILVGAATDFFLGGAAAPSDNRIVVGGSVLGAVTALIAYITASAVAAFELAGKAGNVQGLICKSA